MSVRPALAKLNHSDVRQRRRAVRHLFELNDPEALNGFEKLLDDPDPWFREKALEAIEKWAASKDLVLIEKLSQSRENTRRLLAARIAIRAGGAGQIILDKLSSDDEPNIRLAAWKARINSDESSIAEAIVARIGQLGGLLHSEFLPWKEWIQTLFCNFFLMSQKLLEPLQLE